MLTKNEEGFLNRYEKRLQGPRWKFIITEGLIWGLFTMIPVMVFSFLIDAAEKPITLRAVLIDLVVWLVGGLVYGFVIRVLHLHQYKKIKKKLSGM